MCAQVYRFAHSSYHCEILPCFHPLNSGFLMDLAPFWAHDGALYMAQKEVVKLGWESDSQNSKQLKGKVVKAGDIGLRLAAESQLTCKNIMGRLTYNGYV